MGSVILCLSCVGNQPVSLIRESLNSTCRIRPLPDTLAHGLCYNQRAMSFATETEIKTDRERYALAALPALLEWECIRSFNDFGSCALPQTDECAMEVARSAFKVADAMIRVRDG